MEIINYVFFKHICNDCLMCQHKQSVFLYIHKNLLFNSFLVIVTIYRHMMFNIFPSIRFSVFIKHSTITTLTSSWAKISKNRSVPNIVKRKKNRDTLFVNCMKREYYSRIWSWRVCNTILQTSLKLISVTIGNKKFVIYDGVKTFCRF